MQQKRQQILLGILGVLVVVFLVWTFVLKSGDTGGGSSEEPTVTTVATAEVPIDGVTPAAPADPSVTEDPAAVAPQAPVSDAPFNPMAYRNPFERVG
jgi:hypothetical protein